jgi:hypothetical protein
MKKLDKIALISIIYGSFIFFIYFFINHLVQFGIFLTAGGFVGLLEYLISKHRGNSDKSLWKILDKVDW